MELLDESRQATNSWNLVVETHPKIIQVVPVISRNVMRYKNSSSTSRIVCWTTLRTSGNTAMGAPCLKLSSSGQYYDTPRDTPTFRDQIRNYLRYKLEVVTGGLRERSMSDQRCREIRVSEQVSERYEPRAENHYNRTFVAFTSYLVYCKF